MANVGRKLFGTPSLRQDWGDEPDEGAAKYWELFLDLVMVAAASSVADGFKENPTLQGFGEFCCLYFIFINAWMMYSHHLTSRFEDSSLTHSMILFFFLLGMASCINNAYDKARDFSYSAALQRIAILVMFGQIIVTVPRARAFGLAFGSIVLLSTILFLLSAIYPNSFAPSGWWLVVLLEFNMEPILTLSLPGQKLVPVNIEHTKERLGVIILIMLGETVISSTISYRELMKEKTENEKDEEEDPGRNYYVILALCFLLIFMFTQYYFHLQPDPSDHAIRRSRTHGLLLMSAYRLLGLALLSMGVGVKLVVEAVVRGERFSDFGSKLLGLSISAALLILFFMRYLHYGGMDRYPRPGDPPNIKALFFAWWALLGVAWVIPILCVLGPWTDPVTFMSIYASLLLVLTIAETSFTHVLSPYLPGGCEHGVVESESFAVALETTPLMQ
jgi:low temperature requirement protein LtrA